MQTSTIDNGRITREYARSLRDEFGGDADSWRKDLKERRAAFERVSGIAGGLTLSVAEDEVANTAEQAISAIDIVLKTYDADCGNSGGG